MARPRWPKAELTHGPRWKQAKLTRFQNICIWTASPRVDHKSPPKERNWTSFRDWIPWFGNSGLCVRTCVCVHACVRGARVCMRPFACVGVLGCDVGVLKEFRGDALWIGLWSESTATCLADLVMPTGRPRVEMAGVRSGCSHCAYPQLLLMCTVVLFAFHDTLLYRLLDRSIKQWYIPTQLPKQFHIQV